MWKRKFKNKIFNKNDGVLPICKLPFPNGSYRNGVSRAIWAKLGQLVIEIRKTISILVDRDNSLHSLNRSNLDANGHKSQPTEHFPREHLMLSWFAKCLNLSFMHFKMPTCKLGILFQMPQPIDKTFASKDFKIFSSMFSENTLHLFANLLFL